VVAALLDQYRRRLPRGAVVAVRRLADRWPLGRVSGVTTRLADKNGRRLFDILRAGDTLVVRWVDRLGRDYADVTDTIRELMRRGVVIHTVINGMTFDGATKDPIQQAVRDALIALRLGLVPLLP
jgi:putative DNA-invertase from lambdoid prophage Rac